MIAEELLERYAAGERNFAGVDLRELMKANFFAARVQRTNFTEANLTGAKFFDHLCDVYCVIFENTIMPNGNLQKELKIWD